MCVYMCCVISLSLHTYPPASMDESVAMLNTGDKAIKSINQSINQIINDSYRVHLTSPNISSFTTQRVPRTDAL